MKVILIPTGGARCTVEDVDISKGLEPLQKLVGGYVQIVPTAEDGIVLAVDEDARMKEVPANVRASALATDRVLGANDLRGPCVLVAQDLTTSLEEVSEPLVRNIGQCKDGESEMAAVLEIENHYERYAMVDTTRLMICPQPPMPLPADSDYDSPEAQAYESWKQDFPWEYTGVGNYEGDSSYFVKVTSCNLLDLVGTEWEFGL